MGMEKPGRIYLIRHADCGLSVYTGAKSNPPLSELGKKQAASLSLWAQAADINMVYSSPLTRAMDTAKAIAETAQLDIKPVDALIELDFGDWEGLSASQIPKEEREKWYHDPISSSPPGGETLAELAKRVVPAFRDIMDTVKGGENIAVVAHGGPLRVIICSVLGLHLSFLWNFGLAHASISAVDVFSNGYSSLSFLNDTHFTGGFS